MGLLVSVCVIALWFGHLAWALTRLPVAAADPLVWAHVLLQGWLTTGLFIVGHDAIHGTVSPSPRVNRAIGRLTALLFAGLSFRRLAANHHRHHAAPCSADDPDFCTRSQNFFVWWGTFLWRYATVGQLLLMAVAYNVLERFFAESALWAYWVIPALLGSFQLFVFGTFLPHRLPHDEVMGPHRSRSQRRHHLFALLSCWFFGYHREHHEHPGTPWWQLWRRKA
ncbi:fatty acid desaturase [Vulgatibacter sp.]|uniref:fatty acid desaturase n=1 Tax=Vulgatibacter sp. TaxID=1971226 RepID=UPI0035689B2F